MCRGILTTSKFFTITCAIKPVTLSHRLLKFVNICSRMRLCGYFPHRTKISQQLLKNFQTKKKYAKKYDGYGRLYNVDAKSEYCHKYDSTKNIKLQYNSLLTSACVRKCTGRSLRSRSISGKNVTWSSSGPKLFAPPALPPSNLL